ncbi:hypothetical protein D347_01188, partial [Enterococcus faecalis LA3B-2]
MAKGKFVHSFLMKYTKKPDTLKMCLFILQYKNEALGLASFHKRSRAWDKNHFGFL